MAIYDQIGQGYDRTRHADPYIASRLIRHLGAGLGRHLDIGCGSGNYTSALARAGLEFIGADVSATMLARAREKAPSIDWVQADAAALPFPSGCFAGALCVFAHHHFSDPGRSLAESFRILSPGARFVLFNSTTEQTRGYWLAEYFPRMMARVIDYCAGLDQTGARLERAGFRTVKSEPYDVRPNLEDHFLYSGKHRPESYLDSRMRAGTSAFAMFGEPVEIAGGCARLTDDINSGRIEQVIASYRHDRGDYMFWIAEK
jgi:ubiquinone/menaquinone biosynthesis C-methylase UbiE